MDLLLVLTYAALCIAISKSLTFHLTNGTVPTAVLAALYWSAH